MLASLAPYNEADTRGGGVSERHRRAGFGFHPRRRLLAVVARGGAYTFGGGSGSRTGGGSILSRMPFRDTRRERIVIGVYSVGQQPRECGGFIIG